MYVYHQSWVLCCSPAAPWPEPAAAPTPSFWQQLTERKPLAADRRPTTAGSFQEPEGKI